MNNYLFFVVLQQRFDNVNGVFNQNLFLLFVCQSKNTKLTYPKQRWIRRLIKLIKEG